MPSGESRKKCSLGSGLGRGFCRQPCTSGTSECGGHARGSTSSCHHVLMLGISNICNCPIQRAQAGGERSPRLASPNPSSTLPATGPITCFLKVGMGGKKGKQEEARYVAGISCSLCGTFLIPPPHFIIKYCI